MKRSLDLNKFKSWKPYYNIVLDTTTYCNAKCPQCHRINSTEGAKLSFAGNVVKELPLIHVPFEKIKKTFTQQELLNYNSIQLCPTWGDHMMHPQAAEIVEHFLSSSWRIVVSINTNGSMRDELYWWKLCSLAVKHKSRYHNRRLHIVFAVDGIDQEMHGLYRRNTNLQKVLDHVKICSEFKERVIVETQTVLFKHNQDYLEEITKLCKEYGAEKHSSVISDRFGEGNQQVENRNVYTFYDENNTKLSLNKVTKDWTAKFKKRGAQINRTNIADLDDKPTCGWSLTNTLNINFDGNVWPCCFFGNVAIMNKKSWTKHHPFVQKYYDYNNNIYENKLEDILKNDWWKELPYVIQSENPVRNCVYSCSNKYKEGQFRMRERLD